MRNSASPATPSVARGWDRPTAPAYLPAMAEALKLGTKDARLFFHAGMIHSYLGQAEQSESYLTRALVTNPYFDSLQADVANATIRQLDSGTGESFAP